MKIKYISVQAGYTLVNVKAAPAHDSIPEDKLDQKQNAGRPSAFIRSGPRDHPIIHIEAIVGDMPFGLSDRKTLQCDLTITKVNTGYWNSVSSPTAQLVTVIKGYGVNGETMTFDWSKKRGKPFGLYGDYKFSFSCKNGPFSWEDSAEIIPLELYLLPVTDLPPVFQHGDEFQIPLMLLRMFVLAGCSKNEPDTKSEPDDTTADWAAIADWVATCTKIVHGTMQPFNGSPSKTKDHWLKYNLAGGGPSFSTQYGTTGLDIGGWLDAYRLWTLDKNKQQKVNCYDQAAATEYALCLGLQHTLINWEFNQVFGFINDSLVGFGKCNNPSFVKKIEDLYLDNPKNPARRAFYNHAYLSWSKNSFSANDYENYNQQMKGASREEYQKLADNFERRRDSRLKMIDACVGPAIGDETRAEYEAKVQAVGDPSKTIYTHIYESTMSERQKADQLRDWTKEDHHLGPGISYLNTSLGWKRQLSVEQIQKFEGLIEKLMEKLPKWEDIKATELTTKNVGKVKTLFDTFVKGRSSWGEQVEIPVRDHLASDDMRVYGVTYSYKLKNTSGISTTLSVTHTATLRIGIALGDRGRMRDICAGHLAYMAITSNSEGDLGSQGAIAAPRGSNPTSVLIVGQRTRRAFVWQNVVVEVYITSKDDWDHDMKDNKIMKSLLDKVVELQTEC